MSYEPLYQALKSRVSVQVIGLEFYSYFSCFLCLGACFKIIVLSNETVIPLALVGYEMIIANYCYHHYY